MRENSNRAGFYVMLGIFAFSLVFYLAIGKFRSFDRVVTVKGLCEKEVPADKVIWPLVFKTIGNDINAVHALAAKKTSSVVDFLKENGLEDREISVASLKLYDRDAEMYPPENMKFRYNATSVVTVSSSRVELVREIMSRQGKLIAQGVTIGINDYGHMTQFLFEGLNELKPVMVEEATQNARDVAEKFAADSHSSLGKIKSASQGQFSIEDRDANTPYIKKVRVVSSVVYFLKD